jgi:hypothetical protein
MGDLWHGKDGRCISIGVTGCFYKIGPTNQLRCFRQVLAKNSAGELNRPPILRNLAIEAWLDK